MKHLFCVVVLCFPIGLLACSSGGGNNNNNNNVSTKECSSPRDCWKKVCPQTDKVDYEECVQKRVHTRLVTGTSEYHKPEYTTCTTNHTCQDVATGTLGAGKVQVAPEPDEVRIKWLRLVIVDGMDMDGKAVTCDQLKTMATQKPEFMMSSDLQRYWPPRDATQPITARVLEQQGSVLPLFFGDKNTAKSVPAGKHVVIVQGFCDPQEGGTPSASTPFQWWLCKENTEIKAIDTNEIPLTLDTKQHPTCK